MLSKPARADFNSGLKLWRAGQAEPRAALTSPLQLAPYPDALEVELGVRIWFQEPNQPLKLSSSTHQHRPVKTPWRLVLEKPLACHTPHTKDKSQVSPGPS